MMSMKSAAVVEEVSPVIASAPPRLNRFTVVFSFLSIYLIWGSTYLAIRYAVETIPPLYTAGLRHLVAGTILLAWCLAKRLRPTWAQVRASIIIGFFFFLIGHGTLHWAEQRVPSGLASLLIASEPIWVFLLGAAAARRWRLNATLLAGILLGFGGVGLLMGRSALNSGPGVFVGSLAIVLGALSWSVGIVYSRRSHLSGHPLLLSALSLLAGSVQLLLAGTVVGEYHGFSLASVARARLSHSLRLGRGLHRLQLAPRTLLSNARCHPHLRQSHRCRLARVALRRRGRHFKRAPLHRPGHWRGHARRSRHDAPSTRPLEFRHFTRRSKIKKARQPIRWRASLYF